MPNGDAVINVPTKSGTFALTSDTPDLSSATASATTDFMKAIINMIYPIGTVLFRTTTENNPQQVFTWQKWELISDGKYIMTTETNDNVGETGGSLTTNSHTLTTNEIPSHTHTFTGKAAGGDFGPIRATSQPIGHATGPFSIKPQSGSSSTMISYRYAQDTSTNYLPYWAWDYTPSGTNASVGGGSGHSHTYQPLYIKLLCFKRTS